MKVLNKYFKVVLCFMAFALCSFMFAFTPSLTAAYAVDYSIEKYNAAINAIKMPQEEVDYSVAGAKFKVPLLSTVLGNKVGDGVDDDSIADYTIRVIDPAGYKHDYVVGANNNDAKYFGGVEGNNLIINAKNDGDYRVIYIIKDGEKSYYSNSYTVTVKNISYELDFSTPVLDAGKNIVGYKKNLMPTKMAESTTPYELPVVYAKQAGEELSIDSSTGAVINDVADIKVTKNGAPQSVNDTANNSIFTEVDGKYYITPSEVGVYTVEYTYENSANRPTKTFTIEVVESFAAKDLTLASTPTLPTIELGKKEITLPKLTFNAGDLKNVDVNVTSIVIEKVGSDGEISYTLANNNFKFDMTPETFGVDDYDDLVGNYTITYTVEDVYGKTRTETFTVDGVTISSKPDIYFAYNYSETDTIDTVQLGAETELKAEYLADGEILLPAAFASDAVTTNFDDFIIIRMIRKGSTYYYVDNYQYNEETGKYMVDDNKVDSESKSYNASGDENIGDVTKAVRFKFNTTENIEGTYYIEYKVITKEVKERENVLYVTGTTEKYSFKVVSSHKATTPTVEITNLQDKSVKSTDKVTVKISAKDDLDTRLNNAVFTYSSMKTIDDTFADYNTIKDFTTIEEFISYAIGKVQGATGYELLSNNILDDENFILEMQKYYNDFTNELVTENSKNNYSLDLTEQSGNVNVVAVTLNDDGNVDTDSKLLTIKDTENDNEAPVIKIYEAELPAIWKDGDDIKHFVVELGDTTEVQLPVVYVNDNADKTLSLNVMYYIDSPESSNGLINYLSPVGKQYYYDTVLGATVPVINGGKIKPTVAGVYYVAYTATDAAGNTSVMYFTFEVKDTAKPLLYVEAIGNNLTQTGNTVEGKKGSVIDFEAVVRSANGESDYTADSNIVISIEDEKGLDYQLFGSSKTSYKFNDYGTYVVTISAKYNGVDADSKVIRVVIKKEEIKWLGTFDVPEYAAKNKEVYLPDIAASNNAVVTVSVTAPGGSAPTAGDAVKVTDDLGFSYWMFKTNTDSKGTYTVTYTATSTDDVLTKTFSIKVGDNVAPVMSFNKGELEQDLVYDGENEIEYVVEVNKSNKTFVVKAINNGKEVYSYNIGLVISDKDDTGSVNSDMSWTNLKYELVGDNVTKGETTSNSTQYFINGTGKYSLKLTMKDSYDNESVETIDFKVVTKSSVKENNDTVVGAVLIVVSLVLLAGVILFFTFTGKGSKGSKVKTKKEKAVKAERVVEVKTEKAVEEKVEAPVAEEAKEVETEETVEETISEEPVVEETQETTEENNEEPKSGEVE